MRSVPTISIYLNKNYTTKSGLHPVKLRVTYGRIPRYFKTGYYLSQSDFEKSYEKIRPRGQFIKFKHDLINIETKAYAILNGLEEFSFEEFENKFYGEKNIKDDVFFFYEAKMAELETLKKYSTKVLYNNSKLSLKQFCEQVCTL